jgi:hypothetical protein
VQAVIMDKEFCLIKSFSQRENVQLGTTGEIGDYLFHFEHVTFDLSWLVNPAHALESDRYC